MNEVNPALAALLDTIIEQAGCIKELETKEISTLNSWSKDIGYWTEETEKQAKRIKELEVLLSDVWYPLENHGNQVLEEEVVVRVKEALENK